LHGAEGGVPDNLLRLSACILLALLRPKELERALGEGLVINSHSQGHLPLKVIVGAPLRLIIRGPIIGLKQQGHGQETRRDTSSAVVQAIHAGETLVPEQLSCVLGEKAVERLPAHEVQILRMGGEEIP
jgi:hypothetical protein